MYASQSQVAGSAERAPDFRVDLDLRRVPTPKIERMIERLNERLETLRAAFVPSWQEAALRNGIIECERELICREIALGRLLEESEGAAS